MNSNNNSLSSQGRQTLLIFWWTKYVQSSSISVYSERLYTANSQVLGTTGTYKILLNLLSLRTDSYVSCMEYCKQFEMNTASIYCQTLYKYRKQKTQPYLQWEILFLSVMFRGLF